jgi:hypothetical protein
LRAGLLAYLDYVEQHAEAYAAVLRSGAGIDPQIGQILDQGRDEFVDEVLQALGQATTPPVQRLLLRGWIGFVEAASLMWLEDRVVERGALVDLLTAQLLTALGPLGLGGALPGA